MEEDRMPPNILVHQSYEIILYIYIYIYGIKDKLVRLPGENAGG